MLSLCYYHLVGQVVKGVLLYVAKKKKKSILSGNIYMEDSEAALNWEVSHSIHRDWERATLVITWERSEHLEMALGCVTPWRIWGLSKEGHSSSRVQPALRQSDSRVHAIFKNGCICGRKPPEQLWLWAESVRGVYIARRAGGGHTGTEHRSNAFESKCTRTV